MSSGGGLDEVLYRTRRDGPLEEGLLRRVHQGKTLACSWTPTRQRLSPAGSSRGRYD